MAHSSEKRWGPASTEVGQVCIEMVENINRGQEKYLQLLEVYSFAGGTDEGFANLLFKEEIANRGTGPTAEEITRALDLKNAMIAVHEIWQAANNVAVPASERSQAMRRLI